MPSSAQHRNTVSYLDDDDDDDDDDDGISSHDGHHRRRSTQPRGYGRPNRPQRENSLVKAQAKSEEHDDSEWDTDYDPKDKYYLSADDDPFDFAAQPQRNPSATRSERSRDRHNSPGTHDSPRTHSTRRASSSRADQLQSRSHKHASRHSLSPSQSRDNNSHGLHSHLHSHSRDSGDNHDVSTVRHESSSSHSRPRPRPKLSRAASSVLSNIHRPCIGRAGSSYNNSRARPRPVRGLSHGNRQTKTKGGLIGQRPWKNFPWEDAARVAFQAGTIAAINVGANSMSWTAKGTEIASAALGAAVVDHILMPKKRAGVKYAAVRHLAEVVMGNVVVGPALGKASGATGRSRRGVRRR